MLVPVFVWLVGSEPFDILWCDIGLVSFEQLVLAVQLVNHCEHFDHILVAHAALTWKARCLHNARIQMSRPGELIDTERKLLAPLPQAIFLMIWMGRLFHACHLLLRAD